LNRLHYLRTRGTRDDVTKARFSRLDVRLGDAERETRKIAKIRFRGRRREGASRRSVRDATRGVERSPATRAMSNAADGGRDVGDLPDRRGEEGRLSGLGVSGADDGALPASDATEEPSRPESGHTRGRGATLVIAAGASQSASARRRRRGGRKRRDRERAGGAGRGPRRPRHRPRRAERLVVVAFIATSASSGGGRLRERRRLTRPLRRHGHPAAPPALSRQRRDAPSRGRASRESRAAAAAHRGHVASRAFGTTRRYDACIVAARRILGGFSARVSRRRARRLHAGPGRVSGRA
jgi:hypothetical protein